VFNAPLLIGASIVLGSVYLVYLGIRLIVQSAGQQAQVAAMPVMPQYASYPMPPQPVVPQTAPVQPAAHYQPRSPGWHLVSCEQRRQLLSQKTAADHAAELSGSMLKSSSRRPAIHRV
jgi:hypothetical protein